MPWNGHDCPCTVGGENIIGNPNRNLGSIGRIDGIGAREHASFLSIRRLPIGIAQGFCMQLIGSDPLRKLWFDQSEDSVNQFMLRSEDTKCHAENGIHARRKNIECQGTTAAPNLKPMLVWHRGLGAIRHPHGELHAFTATDPVSLLAFDPFWPIQVVQVINQTLGILGDLEEPLGYPLFFNEGARPLGTSANDLFVCQHRLVNRVPIYGSQTPVS